MLFIERERERKLMSLSMLTERKEGRQLWWPLGCRSCLPFLTLTDEWLILFYDNELSIKTEVHFAATIAACLSLSLKHTD